MLIFILFFALWLLLNGRLGWDVITVGALVSAAVTFFACRICGWKMERSRRLLRAAGGVVKYFACLFVEIIKANLAMIRVIFSRNCSAVRPQLLFFDSRLKKAASRTVLANSITITPGTYTLDIFDSTLAVHAINTDFADGTPDSSLNRQLQALESRLEKEENP